MSSIRTILRDVPTAGLGPCYAHEHIVIQRSYTTEKHPEFLLDDLGLIGTELDAFYASGGRAMVDSMPCGGGRSARKLAELSKKSKVHIVCPTGLHLQKYYPQGHWSERAKADAIAKIFIEEIEHGIDGNDTCGPMWDSTGLRAGVIKVASGLNSLSDFEKKIFEAAAIAHHATGSPILTHTEQGTAAFEQIRTFRSMDVPPECLVLSHTDRLPDIAYHRELLACGVYLEYDSAFRWKSGSANPTRDLIVSLCDEGFASQILVGMDAARSTYWRSYGGCPGLSFLLETFFPELIKSGFPPEYMDRILVQNPANAYGRFEASAADSARNSIQAGMKPDDLTSKVHANESHAVEGSSQWA